MNFTSNKPDVTVLDFDKKQVYTVTQKQARELRDRACREGGHYFATANGDVPPDDGRCVCGDITWAEWQA